MMHKIATTTVCYLLLAGALFSCKKSVSENQDLLHNVPGGTITTTLKSYYKGTFVLNNESFPSYGCSVEENGTGYTFYLELSGKKNDTLYYIKANGTVLPDQYKALTANPNQSFNLNNVKAQVDIRIGQTSFYLNNPGNTVPGTMTLSNLGNIGDNVQINFFFMTSQNTGFYNMDGIVNTRYVVH